MNLPRRPPFDRWIARWRSFRQAVGPGSSRLQVFLFFLLVGGIVTVVRVDNTLDDLARRLANGKSPKLEHFIALGWFHAGITAVVVAVAGVVTARWWARPCRPVVPLSGPSLFSSRREAWIFAAVLAGCLVAAGVARAPRLNHGFWNDEEYAFRHYVWGRYVAVEPEGPLEFEPVTWQQTLFLNEHGNNHVWSSVEARLGLLLFNRPGDGSVPVFQEAAARALPFLSGLLTVAAVGWLGAMLGGIRAGGFTAFLLAVSPWHIRYSVEMRGYSTMLLAICGALICLILALQSSRWRWWLAYAACQTVYLLCFAGSVYVALAANGMALFLILTGADRTPNAARLILINALSLVAFLFVFAPSIPQLTTYLESTHNAHSYSPINLYWLMELWAHLSNGVFWLRSLSQPSGGTSLQQIRDVQPWAFWASVALLPLLVATGLTRLGLTWRTRLVLVTLAGAALVSCLHNSLKGNPLLGWYLLYLLPLFALALVWSSDWLPVRFQRLGLVLVALVYLFATAIPRNLLARVPRQTLADAVEAIHGEAPAVLESGFPLTATFGTSDRQSLSYDPRVHIVSQADELKALMTRAKAENRDFHLFFCGHAHPRADRMELFELAHGPAWTHTRTFPAMEHLFTYEVYRFQPDAWRP